MLLLEGALALVELAVIVLLIGGGKTGGVGDEFSREDDELLEVVWASNPITVEELTFLVWV